MIKNLPEIQETQEKWVQSLGWEDPLEEEMATTSVFLTGKSHGQRSLTGYSLWGPKEIDMTEHLSTYMHVYILTVTSYMVKYYKTYYKVNQIVCFNITSFII